MTLVPVDGQTVSSIARIAHEANRAYCESIGDNSQPRAEDAPAWQRDSARAGVEAIHANGDLTPAESHENWLALKDREGWVYGETKDADAKRHPCMVPYDQLPPEQKVKDALFGAVVRALSKPAQD